MEPDSVTGLLQVRGLAKRFGGRRGAVVKAVDGVDLDLADGETLGVVGESGCGKSTLGRLILRLLVPSAGTVLFRGVDLGARSRSELRALAAEMQMIFQDPYASLDPRQKVGALVREPLDIHKRGSRGERRRMVAELLQTVGLDTDAAGRYPHEFSGGQRQRIGIARAIALRPKLIVADEPVSA